MVQVEFGCGYVTDISVDRVTAAIQKNWGLYCEECKEEEEFFYVR